jgi:hypothetical protein
MKFIMILLAACLLVGCGEMKSVEGSPEVLVNNSNSSTTLTVQSDGQRLITIRHGEVVHVIILLPPATTKASLPVEIEKK